MEQKDVYITNNTSYTQSDQPTIMESETTPSSPVPHESKKRGTIAETIRFGIISLLIVIPFRMFIAQPFLVSGASMDPTFADGEYLIVDQVSYKLHAPQRGDVIVFKYPRDLSKYFIKRIIGLPQETVQIKNGWIIVTNETTSTPVLELYSGKGLFEEETTTLKENEYFVVGDNRSASSDSRAWGPLQEQFIIGTPFVRLFPFSRIDFRPGTSFIEPSEHTPNAIN